MSDWKRVRDLVIGDVFYAPHHPADAPVQLVEKEVKTGAWFQLGVRWAASDRETELWYLNPKPLGTEKVRMCNVSNAE